MMLRHDLRTDAQICGNFASQASLFVHHGRDVNRVYFYHKINYCQSRESFSNRAKIYCYLRNITQNEHWGYAWSRSVLVH